MVTIPGGRTVWLYASTPRQSGGTDNMSQTEGTARNRGGNAVATTFVTLRNSDLSMLNRSPAISRYRFETCCIRSNQFATSRTCCKNASSRSGHEPRMKIESSSSTPYQVPEPSFCSSSASLLTVCPTSKQNEEIIREFIQLMSREKPRSR